MPAPRHSECKRPNPNLITFRNGQLRAFAAGISASYSSVSRNYDGTYSSQRQELVEQWVHYACLTDDFVSMSAQLMTQLGDERIAQRLVGVWGGYVDRQLGRGLRRLAMYAVMALLGLGALKFDWFSRLLGK